MSYQPTTGGTRAVVPVRRQVSLIVGGLTPTVVPPPPVTVRLLASTGVGK
jgi:hypothetical protein